MQPAFFPFPVLRLIQFGIYCRPDCPRLRAPLIRSSQRPELQLPVAVVLWHPEGCNGAHPATMFATNAIITIFFIVSDTITSCLSVHLSLRNSDLFFCIDWSCFNYQFFTQPDASNEPFYGARIITCDVVVHHAR